MKRDRSLAATLGTFVLAAYHAFVVAGLCLFVVLVLVESLTGNSRVPPSTFADVVAFVLFGVWTAVLILFGLLMLIVLHLLRGSGATIGEGEALKTGFLLALPIAGLRHYRRILEQLGMGSGEDTA